MRFVCLLALASCSALVPQQYWHPQTWIADEGQPGCPSYGYPIADVAFGAPVFALGAVSAVTWSTGPMHGVEAVVDQAVWRTLAIIGLVAGSVWIGSSIYGFSHEAACHDELSRLPAMNGNGAEVGSATRAR